MRFHLQRQKMKRHSNPRARALNSIYCYSGKKYIVDIYFLLRPHTRVQKACTPPVPACGVAGHGGLTCSGTPFAAHRRKKKKEAKKKKQSRRVSL